MASRAGLFAGSARSCASGGGGGVFGARGGRAVSGESSYVIKACQRLHRTGERSARAQRSHTPRKLSEQHHAAIRAQVTAQPDATIAELRGWVLREHGITISMASMWTTLVRLSLTLKKSSPRGRAGSRGHRGSPRRLGQAAAEARSREAGLLGRDLDHHEHGSPVWAQSPG